MNNLKHISHKIVATLIATIFSCSAFAITGSWKGELAIGRQKLPLVFNFSEDGSGKTNCTIDSPLQGVKGIATEVSKCTADSVVVECKMIGANFTAHIADNVIDGIFAQRGMSFPLTLTPESSLDERRPQTPKAPFPYASIDTTFFAADGTALAATLTLPKGTSSESVPAVVMVTGSGPQNRDEEIFEHKPFAVIADYLARHGIASLRYDDRGVGSSKGNFSTSTTYTFKDDAASAIEFLRVTPQIGSVGVLGHSEGGTIAYMLGSEQKVDFIISLAGMATSAKETLMNQNSRQIDLIGLDTKAKENSLELISKVFDAIAEQGRNDDHTPIDVDNIISSSNLSVPPAIISSIKQTVQSRTPWFDKLLTLNPSEYLGNISCPVLAINGDKDLQVDATGNLNVINNCIHEAEIHLMPGLNHLMQHATTGEIAEYNEIRETISPEVLDIILSFCRKH